jgi:hypothetical protein
MKRIIAALGVMAVLLVHSVLSLSSNGFRDEEITAAEANEAKEFALVFSNRLDKAKDFAPLIDEFYFDDFVDRYFKFINSTLAKTSPDSVYFAPGLEYNSKLHTEVSREDWRRFYVAANNFIYLGFVSGLSKLSLENFNDVKPDDLYPPEALALMSKNPNLSNMVMKKSGSPPISTVEEMRGATSVLEKAVSLIREKQSKDPPELTSRYKKNAAAILKADLMKPSVQISDGEMFGLVKGTRIIAVNTPAAFKLMLARVDGKLKVLWATPNTDD